ncbi:ATP-dependent 6-phosphofructokinase [Paremcibacter congregatus]|uniref:6-phosphofructokinase n=1 Tax=Paremcibacter congregatus TaxID=2043170 RepID=UPI0030EEC808|tara:strand:- start:11255 stop:12406 length:1152 start_codon:yes stop_codon:yes gene_type:complete
MRIGVLTSGGDVPGLNACIKAIVQGADDRGWTVVGIRRGWRGLMSCDLSLSPQGDHCRVLSRHDVDGIENIGGTILHTSRLNPAQLHIRDVPGFLQGKLPPGIVEGSFDGTNHILRVLDYLDVDVLIPIGGDGSLRFAAHLHSKGFPVISIPKTMDNDVYGTDYCIGYSTCVTRCVDSLNTIRTSISSHERVALIELFGRHSGEPTLIAGHIASANRVLIPEVPVDLERLRDLLLKDKWDNPHNYALAVVAEGVRLTGRDPVYEGQKDVYGRRRLGGIGRQICAAFREEEGLDCMTQSLAYLLRSGEPDALDKLAALSFGMMALQLLDAGETGRMTALRNGIYTTVDAGHCLEGQKRIDVGSWYDAAAYRPEIRNIVGRPLYL